MSYANYNISSSIQAAYGAGHERHVADDGSSVVFIRAKHILAMYEVHRTDPVHSGCRDSLLGPIITNLPDFYYNGVHQKLTPRFKRIVEEYWGPSFSVAFLDTYWVVGVVPATVLVLNDGTKVPHVLEPGTYDLAVYFSPVGEAKCYGVYRTALAGASELGGLRAGEMEQIMRDFLMGGAFGNHSSMGSIAYGSGVEDPSMLLRGPAYIDDAELRTCRLDLGELFPQLGRPDPCCIVLRGFGHDPLLNGVLTSVVARTMPDWLEVRTHRAFNTMQEGRVANMQTMVETPPPSNEYIHQLALARAPPRGINDPLADEGVVRHVARNDVEIQLASIMARDQQQSNTMSMAQMTGGAPMASSTALSSGGPSSALDAARNLDAYAANVSVQRNMANGYTLVHPGGNVVNRTYVPSERNLKTLIDHTTQTISMAYGVPVVQFQSKATTHSDTSNQQNTKYQTQNLLSQMLSRVLTSFYRLIYGRELVNDSLSFLYRRFLSEEAVTRLRNHFDVVDERERMRLTINVMNMWTMRANERMSMSVGSPDENSAAVRAITEQYESDRALLMKYYDELGHVRQNEDGSMVLPETLHDVLEAPEKQLARLGMRRIFLNYLTRWMDSDNAVELFERGDVGQVSIIAREVRNSAAARARAALTDGGKDPVDGIEVSLGFSAPQTIEAATSVLALGGMNKHEWERHVRTQMFLPIQCDRDRDASNGGRTNGIDNLMDFLASSEAMKAIKDTPLGILSTSIQGGLVKERQEQKKKQEQAAKQRAAGTATKTKKKSSSVLGKRKERSESSTSTTSSSSSTTTTTAKKKKQKTTTEPAKAS